MSADSNDEDTTYTRTWKNVFTISWTPASQSLGVTVSISAQGLTLYQHTFGPGDTTENVKFNDGMGTSAVGDLTVTFEGSAGNSQLATDSLEWTTGGEGGTIVGLIGNW